MNYDFIFGVKAERELAMYEWLLSYVFIPNFVVPFVWCLGCIFLEVVILDNTRGNILESNLEETNTWSTVEDPNLGGKDGSCSLPLFYCVAMNSDKFSVALNTIRGQVP